MFETLILPRWILPIAPKNVVLEDHGVIVDQGRIVAILPTSEALKKPIKKMINLRNHALMPGFVNAHTHAAMNLMRGIADDLPLHEWLNNYIWPTEAKIVNEAQIAKGSALAITEMLRGGTTCFNDHYFFPQVTAECAIKMGIRACLGLHVMNPFTGYAKGEEDSLAKAKEIYRRFAKIHPLITWMLAPQGPYSVSDGMFKKIVQFSEETHLPIHLHLLETQDEIDMSLREFGKRPIQRLTDLGLFQQHTVAVHMIHLNEAEMDFVASRPIHIAHCAEANMKLASGFAPIKNFLQRGINVAIGTDGAASNNDLDMIGEMRSAALIAKGFSRDATVLNAADTLKAATLNGARALLLDKEIGSIEVGKAADVIAIDLGDEMLQPIHNVMSHLVYATCRNQVSDVWVAGQHLVRNHRLLTSFSTAMRG